MVVAVEAEEQQQQQQQRQEKRQSPADKQHCLFLDLLIYLGHLSRGYLLWEGSSQLILLVNVLTDLPRGFSLSDARSCHIDNQDEPSETRK